MTAADKSRLAQYSLSAAPGAPYRLGINYRLGGIFNCFAYNMQIDVAPAATLQSLISCNGGASAVAIPTSIDLSSGSAAATIDSFINGWSAVSGMQTSVTFSVTGSAVTGNFMFAYNSLVTAYSTKLLIIRPSGTSTIFNGQTRGQQIPSGITNVYSYISTSIRLLTTFMLSLLFLSPLSFFRP